MSLRSLSSSLYSLLLTVFVLLCLTHIPPTHAATSLTAHSQTFSIYENFMKAIQFSNSSQAAAVTLDTIPSPSTGQLWYYVQPNGWRGDPIVSAPVTITDTMMIWYVPAMNAYGTPLSTFKFHLTDTNAQVTPQATITLNVVYVNQPPVVQNLAYEFIGPTAVTQIIQLQATDVDATAQTTLEVIITTLPTTGLLYQYDATKPQGKGVRITEVTSVIDSQYRVVFTTPANVAGRPYASFQYTADDGNLDCETAATVDINVYVAEIPVAVSSSHITREDLAVAVQLGATSSVLTASVNRATITQLPVKGALYHALEDGSRGSLIQAVPTYISNSNRTVFFVGNLHDHSNGLFYTSFTFTINNGLYTSTNTGTASVNVTFFDYPPTADDINAASDTNSEIPILFNGNDIEGQTVSALLMTYPPLGRLKYSNGTRITADMLPIDLKGMLCIYTPLPTGRYVDEFEYKLSDGSQVSIDSAKVTVVVGGVNHAPIAYNSTVACTQVTTYLPIILNGTDIDDNDVWRAVIVTPPLYGTLHQAKGLNILGDLFSIQNLPVTDPGSRVFYVPARFSPAYDRFTYVQQDLLKAKSVLATITIYVAPINAPPVTTSANVLTLEDEPVVIQLPVIDYDSAVLDVTILVLPTVGELYVYDNNTNVIGAMITTANYALPSGHVTVYYKPPLYTHGKAINNHYVTSLVFKATDGFLTSNDAQVDIGITPVNHPPVCSDTTITVDENSFLLVPLPATDPDTNSEPLTTFWVTFVEVLPNRGELFQTDALGQQADPILNVGTQVNNARVIYRPNFLLHGDGVDVFSFFAIDDRGALSATSGVVTVNVRFVNQAPMARDLIATNDEFSTAVTTYTDEPIWFRMPYFDYEDDHCTFNLTHVPAGTFTTNVSNPVPLQVGSIVDVPLTTYNNLTGVWLRFTPPPYISGDSRDRYYYDTLRFTVYDGELWSKNRGNVDLVIISTNPAPYALNTEVRVLEDGCAVVELNVAKFDKSYVSAYIDTVPDPAKGILYQYSEKAAARGDIPLGCPAGDKIILTKSANKTQPVLVFEILADDVMGIKQHRVVFVPTVFSFGENFATWRYHADDGQKASNDATALVHVTHVNHAPTATSRTAMIQRDIEVIALEGKDVDKGDTLFYRITSLPRKGKLYTCKRVYNTTVVGSSTFTQCERGDEIKTTSTKLTLPYVQFDANSQGGSVPYVNFTYSVYDVPTIPTNKAQAYGNGYVQLGILCSAPNVLNNFRPKESICVACPKGAVCSTEGTYLPGAQAGYWRTNTPNGLVFMLCVNPEACLGSPINPETDKLLAEQLANGNGGILNDQQEPQCETGYGGRMCAKCSDASTAPFKQFYSLNGVCKICPERNVFWLVMIMVPMIVGIMIVFVFVARRGIDLAFFLIVLNFFQTLTIFSQYNLLWPTSVAETYTVFSLSILNLDVFAVQCYYDATYSSKWIAKMVLPLGVFIVFAVIFVLYVIGAYLANMMGILRPLGIRSIENHIDPNYRSLYKQDPRYRQQLVKFLRGEAVNGEDDGSKPIPMNNVLTGNWTDESQHPNEKRGGKLGQYPEPAIARLPVVSQRIWNFYCIVWRSWSVFLGVAYLPINQQAFQLFNCTRMADGSLALQADPTLRCDDDWWYALRPAGVLAVIVYGLGIPCWFAYCLYRSRPALSYKKVWGFIPWLTEDPNRGAMVGPVTNNKRMSAIRVGGGVGGMAGGGGMNKVALVDPSSNAMIFHSQAPRDTNPRFSTPYFYGALRDPFSQKHFMWILAHSLRKYLLAMSGMFFAMEPMYQATLGLMVLFFSTLAHLRYLPMHSPAMNQLERNTLFACNFVLFMGLLFFGDRHGGIRVFLTVITMMGIVLSCLYVAHITWRKAEEAFGCRNCRRVHRKGDPDDVDAEKKPPAFITALKAVENDNSDLDGGVDEDGIAVAKVAAKGTAAGAAAGAHNKKASLTSAGPVVRGNTVHSMKPGDTTALPGQLNNPNAIGEDGLTAEERELEAELKIVDEDRPVSRSASYEWEPENSDVRRQEERAIEWEDRSRLGQELNSARQAGGRGRNLNNLNEDASITELERRRGMNRLPTLGVPGQGGAPYNNRAGLEDSSNLEPSNLPLHDGSTEDGMSSYGTHGLNTLTRDARFDAVDEDERKEHSRSSTLSTTVRPTIRIPARTKTAQQLNADVAAMGMASPLNSLSSVKGAPKPMVSPPPPLRSPTTPNSKAYVLFSPPAPNASGVNTARSARIQALQGSNNGNAGPSSPPIQPNSPLSIPPSHVRAPSLNPPTLRPVPSLLTTKLPSIVPSSRVGVHVLPRAGSNSGTGTGGGKSATGVGGRTHVIGGKGSGSGSGSEHSRNGSGSGTKED